jgi:transcriptional regulator with XRE-family HTH domain
VTTRLREMRRAAGLSQVELARKAGIDQQRVSAAERSLDPRRISAGTIIPVARALGIKPEDIMNESTSY